MPFADPRFVFRIKKTLEQCLKLGRYGYIEKIVYATSTSSTIITGYGGMTWNGKTLVGYPQREIINVGWGYGTCRTLTYPHGIMARIGRTGEQYTLELWVYNGEHFQDVERHHKEFFDGYDDFYITTQLEYGIPLDKMNWYDQTRDALKEIQL